MASLVMTTPQKGNPMVRMLDDLDENDGFEFSNKRAMSDYLDEAAASATSPVSVSSNRSQGFGLCNTRTQLLKMNSLYDDDEGQSLNRSLDHSRDYSQMDKSLELSGFYLQTCVSKETRNSLSPLYAASSASYTASNSCTDSDENEDENDFLVEARASLRELQEWQHDMETTHSDDEGDVSSCDASCNSSYDGNEDVNNSFDTKSACGFDEFHGTSRVSIQSPRSCPDLFSSKRAQNNRSAATKSWLKEIKHEELEQRKRIAEAIAASASKANSPHVSRRSIGSKLKNPAKLFRNKEKAGRHKRTFFARRHRRSGLQEDCEERDDNNDLTAPTRSTSSNNTPEPSPVSATNHNGKELQLKRAFLGSARVVTMDGIVESFADDSTAISPSSTDALNPIVASKRMEYAPTSEGPLTWV